MCLPVSTIFPCLRTTILSALMIVDNLCAITNVVLFLVRLKLTSKNQHELLRRLHVIDNGKVIAGAKAFIIIWSKIPKYNVLSKLFSIKLFFIPFHYLYEFVAYFLYLKNRKQLK